MCRHQQMGPHDVITMNQTKSSDRMDSLHTVKSHFHREAHAVAPSDGILLRELRLYQIRLDWAKGSQDYRLQQMIWGSWMILLQGDCSLATTTISTNNKYSILSFTFTIGLAVDELRAHTQDAKYVCKYWIEARFNQNLKHFTLLRSIPKGSIFSFRKGCSWLANNVTNQNERLQVHCAC